MAFIIWVSLVLAFMSSFSSCSAEISRKDLRTNADKQDTVGRLDRAIQFNRIDPSQVIQLSWRPRVFLYRRFLSEEECDLLISLARGTKEKLLGNDIVSGKIDTNRPLAISETPWNIQDDIAARIEERISAWTFLPKENSRPLQILHYGLEEAKQKCDFLSNKSTLGVGEHLMATVVLYLSNVTQGGEIIFPESELKDSNEKGNILSDCTKSSYVLRPIKGNAILFFTLHPNASPDKSSSHARCPVLEGEMWCATKSFHIKAINAENILSESDGSECNDEHENCYQWASIGECQRNPLYMIGSADYYGTCRKSCKAC